MSNFNQYLKTQGIQVIMSKFFDDVDRYNTEHKITSLTYKMEPNGDYPASYYIENSQTATFRVDITYYIDGNMNNPLTSEFEIPREIDGTFIIEGSYRIATSRLGSDWDCRINDSAKGGHYVNFDYDRRYDCSTKTLTIWEYSKELGARKIAKKIKYDQIPEMLMDPESAKMLELTPAQIRKWEIKLDLDYHPTHITTQLIDDCVAFGDDRVKDLIIDKTIESVPRSFMQFLFRDNRGTNFFSARNTIVRYFGKFSKLQDQINTISNLCARFWKGGSGINSDLQIPPGISAVALESYKYKIQIPLNVAYNHSFADLIDIGDTPINQNVNIANELTVSTHLNDDGTVLFDVYDKDFNKITIDYNDYLNSKVVASESVDYEKKTLKPDENGMVWTKYRMKKKKFKVEEIQLIDLHPDYRLSPTSRQIPFLNFTDSVRIMMGDGMLRQSIPLPNAQKPLVATGNNDDLKDNVLNDKFTEESGKVIDITNDDVIVELPNGKHKKFPRRTAIQSLNDVAVFTEPKVKIGQKVKKGDIITGAHEIEPEGIRLGLNTLVLYGPHKGLVNEDAVVVSESYADRMASYSLIDISIDVTNSSALKWIAPIGTKVKSKDAVVTVFKAIQLNNINKILNEKLGPLMTDEDGKGIVDYTIENHLVVPNNIEEAVVSDVMIQENTGRKYSKKETPPDFTFARTSEKYIKEYEKSKDRGIIFDKYPEYIASDTLDPVSLDLKSNKVLYTIRVRLIKRTRLVVGSKLSNRYGGKGVISAIEPDEAMPIIVDNDGNKKRCELVMNPYSTINRKIPSVIMEIGLANCITRMHDLVDKYKKTATGRKKIMPMIKKYYPGRYDDMDVEDFIKLHDSKPIEDVYNINVSSYSNYTPDKIQKMMDDLGTSTQSKVLYPKLQVMDLDELKDTLSPEEYDKVIQENRGKFTEVQRPMMAGEVTMIELYHMPQYSNKVTTDMVDVHKNSVPIAGYGNYRANGGQKVSEMDLWALLSRNARGFIESSRESVIREQNQRFLNNLLGLGMYISDEKGFPQGGSQLKDTLSRMKDKYKLKNGGSLNGKR